ncbi:MAG: ATP-binding cassette domain-containing protein [Myxococcales bacterium]|nr:ABC transporter ATP-binding protein [Myxococcota bacterium]MDW8282788.1 ATP-binding cassette domain-containing protein [Myxococcales bacterium]
MIEVQGLCKDFAGGVRALREVSFSAAPGGVLGFLGPNGAGKTTTLRILAGYLRPSAGSARICGHDVVTDSLAARRLLGYLPEQVPLYREMRVQEYLTYRAELRGLRRAERRRAVGEALERVGLAGQAERIIGQLSKGFRQRVGLADALLHQPPALVLDEPTDGLDPNQRREVLDLIAQLGQERAVVLSTHVLPEVERICKEVVILDRGRVVASGPLVQIAERLVDHEIVEIRCRGPAAALAAALRQVPGVIEVMGLDAEGEGPHDVRVRLSAERVQHEAERSREELARAVLSVGALQELRPARSGLEAVFRWLTAAEASP